MSMAPKNTRKRRIDQGVLKMFLKDLKDLFIASISATKLKKRINFISRKAVVKSVKKKIKIKDLLETGAHFPSLMFITKLYLKL